MCAKGQIILEFSLMWIRLTCLLAFHMPWDRSDSAFHYRIEELYKEPFGYIERGGIEEQENYSPLFLKLDYTWVCIPLSLGALFVLPKLSFSCEIVIERWRIEVVEAQVEDLVSSVHISANRVCHYCISDLLIEISISCPIHVHKYEYCVHGCIYLLIHGLLYMLE